MPAVRRGHSGGEHGRRVPRLAQHVLPRAVPAASRAAEKGMRATVNADAHCAEALCFAFAPAREMLRQAGFSSVWVLRGGAFCEEEL